MVDDVVAQRGDELAVAHRAGESRAIVVLPVERAADKELHAARSKQVANSADQAFHAIASAVHVEVVRAVVAQAQCVFDVFLIEPAVLQAREFLGIRLVRGGPRIVQPLPRVG